MKKAKKNVEYLFTSLPYYCRKSVLQCRLRKSFRWMQMQENLFINTERLKFNKRSSRYIRLQTLLQHSSKIYTAMRMGHTWLSGNKHM